MSNNQYHKKRLEQQFESLIKAEPHDGLEHRACLTGIMLTCHVLHLDVRAYLREKFVEQYKAELAMGDNTEEYRCRDCGDPFPTPQARNGHMAHCKKGGGRHV